MRAVKREQPWVQFFKGHGALRAAHLGVEHLNGLVRQSQLERAFAHFQSFLNEGAQCRWAHASRGLRDDGVDVVFFETLQSREVGCVFEFAINQQRLDALLTRELGHLRMEAFAGFDQWCHDVNERLLREVLHRFHHGAYALLFDCHIAIGTVLRADF